MIIATPIKNNLPLAPTSPRGYKGRIPNGTRININL